MNSKGTRLHQQARKNIQKRKPALLRAIKKFNDYCETLRSFELPFPNFPIPSPLPTDFSELQNDETLMFDVWVDSNTINTNNQAWLIDPKVREGIRFIHDINRSTEEHRRLG